MSDVLTYNPKKNIIIYGAKQLTGFAEDDMITTKSNDYLSNCFNKDRKTGNNMLPLIIKDLSGSTLFFAKQAWIKNFPESKRGRKISNQDWTFNTGQVDDPIIGGND